MRRGLSQAERRRYWRGWKRTQTAYPDRNVCSVPRCTSKGSRHHWDGNPLNTDDWNVDGMCRKHHHAQHPQARDKRGRFARRQA